MKRLVSACPIWILALLAGCGGGGGGSSGGSGLSNLTYPASSLSLTVGIKAPSMTPTVQGLPSSWEIDSALPSGLEFDTATGEIRGRPSTPSLPKTYAISAVSSKGRLSIELELAVKKPAKLVYIPDAVQGSLAVFSLNALNGTLARIGSGKLVESPTRLIDFATRSVDGFALFADPGALSSVSLDPVTGRPSLGSGVALGGEPHSMRISPSGRFIYVLDRLGLSLRTIAIDSGTGALTELAGAATAIDPVSFEIDPLGEFLFVASATGRTLEVFEIDANSGIPSRKFAQNLTDVPGAIAVAPSGDFVAVAEPLANGISVFGFVRSENILSPIHRRGTGKMVSSLAYHPNGRTLFATKPEADAFAIFPVDPSGSIAASLGDFPSSDDPQAIRLDPSGLHAFVTCKAANAFDLVRLSQLDSTPNKTTSEAALGSPLPVSTLQGDEPLEVESTRLFALNSNSISPFRLDFVTGSLESMGQDVPCGTAATDLAIDPYGRFLFASDRGQHKLYSFPIDADTGELGNPFSLPLPNGLREPVALTVEPTGRFLYVAADALGCCPTLNFLISYKILQNSGHLEGQATDTTWSSRALGTANPRQLGFDPTGRYLYLSTDVDFQTYTLDNGQFAEPLLASDPGAAVGAESFAFAADGKRVWATLPDIGEFRTYGVHPQTGAWTFLSATPAQESPWSITTLRGTEYILASHRFNGGPGKLSIFLPSAVDGVLVEIDHLSAGFDTRAIAFDSGLRRLYTANSNTDHIAIFEVDSENGTLDLSDTAATGVQPIDFVVNTVLR